VGVKYAFSKEKPNDCDYVSDRIVDSKGDVAEVWRAGARACDTDLRGCMEVWGTQFDGLSEGYTKGRLQYMRICMGHC
jgi:hypothetical protein